MGKKCLKAQGKVLWNPKGYAFLSGQGPSEDIFIPPEGLNSAMDGDLVEVRVYRDRKGLRGMVTAVLERAGATVTGIYTRLKKRGVIEPFRPFPYSVVVPHGYESTATSGDSVSATVIPPKTVKRISSVSAKIDRTINIPDTVGGDLRSVATRYGIPWNFPDEVVKEAERVSDIDMMAELSRRVDLRGRVLFTIDGVSAKDFDDAVGIEWLDDGTFLLTVAIADVSHLVMRGSSLDREAWNRGFSVYFPETAVPMLPEVLSTGVMSLNPGEDRLAVVVEVHLGPRARILGFRCYEAVIRSRARLTYEEIGPFLEGTALSPANDPEIDWRLKALHTMASHLFSVRKKRGSLDLDIPETRVLIKESGEVEDVSVVQRGPGERLIEEAMLCANHTVCTFLHDHHMPVLYRIHEHPCEEDLLELCETMKEIGLPQAEHARLHAAIMSRSRLSRALQDLSEYYTGTPLSRFVNQHILRALMRARYSHDDLGHFGLATRGYLHFTSPIRRYPDLVIHRLVKMALRDTPPAGKERTKLNKYLKYVGSETSRREETTDEAMMEAVKLKAASFMARRIGHEFSAVVTSIVPYGMFIEVTDPPVDGLIPAALRTRGRSGRGRKQRPNTHSPRIGDVVSVRLTRVDRLKGLLDFALVDDQGRT